MKTILRLLFKVLFGFKQNNGSVLTDPGPLLLLPNHVSWFDWLFIAVCLNDGWKFVTSIKTANTSWLHRFIMINRYTFPVDTDSPYSVKRMAEFLQGGGKLVLFPEGRLSRTGSLMKLFDGTGFLLFKTNAKVITCYLRGAEQLPFSPNPNKRHWFPRVSIHFSSLLTPPKLEEVSTTKARYKLTRWLHDRMLQQRFEIETAASPSSILEAIVNTARKHPCRTVLEDISSTQLTYRRILAGGFLLSKEWKSLFGPAPERIGVLLPNTNAMALTLISLWAAGKTPAILNYSTGLAAMLSCVQLAGLKHIVCSRTFLDRAKIDVSSMKEAGIEFVFLEDVREGISGFDRLTALVRVTIDPAAMVPSTPADSTAVILFTSGSEGPPKGVELTHRNLLANMQQMLSSIDVVDQDRFFNALPLFHSFGLTVGLLLPLVRGNYVFLYPSPLHYRIVPTAFYNLDCTIFFGTNTFLSGYARKAHPYDFRSLRYLFAGAEKLQESTATLWAQRFGVRILEGYGATECSPCLSANTLMNVRPGSAGRFLPGIEYKLEPVSGVEHGGRLWVKGPNVMKGYLNAEANKKFKELEGWYDTGDIARVDDDGFVFILGRIKRFAKISGEMVSLTAVEEALAGGFPHYGLHLQVAVLSRPDPDRGEALILVSNDQRLKLDEIRPILKAKGFSNLCVPRELIYLHEIPKLGTGKVSYRELDKLISKP